MLEARRFIDNLKPLDFEQYKNIDLNSLTVYAIHILDEQNIPPTFENICVAAFRMFPKKFSMVGYEKYPDAARVNRSLLQLRPKYKNYATGGAKSGFALTELGRITVERTEQLLTNPKLQIQREEDEGKRTLSYKKEIEKIINSPIYKKYSSGKEDEIGLDEVYEFLRAVPYTDKKELRRTIGEKINMTMEVGNDEVLQFLKWMRTKKFAQIFTDQKGKE